MNKTKLGIGLATTAGIVLVLLLASNPLANYLKAGKYGSPDCFDHARQPVNCTYCMFTGRVFTHSFGTSCSLKAPDNGEACIYDSDCSTYSCVYENQGATEGRCDAYTGDNSREDYCHRPEEEVICGPGFIS